MTAATAICLSQPMTDLAPLLSRVAGLADEFKLANLRSQIAACQNLMQARNGIDVAVFGRFKAGRSSFLNHLDEWGAGPYRLLLDIRIR
jgi:hypothetical protein